MIELTEIIHQKNGKKDESKKLFSSLAKLMRMMRVQGYLPGRLIYDLNKKREIKFKMNGLKREMKVVEINEAE